MRIAIALVLLAAPAFADDAPYAGLDTRDIAALSQSDIAALQAGEGWGLALPAELNGWPGPRHVLDAAEELGLSDDQILQVQTIFDAMNQKAVAVGADLVRAERALDTAFAAREIDQPTLLQLLSDAEDARSDLRAVHLSAHLETTPLLSRHQRVVYDRLRGYGDGGHSDHGGHGGQQ